MEVYKRDERKCYICQKELLINEVELDHLIPVSRNGHSGLDNLAVSCQFCNRSRGTTIGVDQLRKLLELRAKI
jgi:5-methylcytosine-specific restriction endonuclease McrA